jgi:signal transduction histidine kinase
LSPSRVSTALRGLNLLLAALWLQTLGPLQPLFPRLPQAVLVLVLAVSAALALLSEDLPESGQTGMLVADVAALGLACAWAQSAGSDLFLTLLVPMILAALTLPPLPSALVCGCGCSALALLGAMSSRAWSDPALWLRPGAALLAAGSVRAAAGALAGARTRALHRSHSSQRQAQIAEFITHVLFQLREYLTSMTTVTEHLALSAQDPATKALAEKLARIVQEANSKLVRTVDSVRTTTRVCTVKPPSEFDLRALLDEAREAALLAHPRPLVQAEVSCPRGISVRGNRKLLLAVVTSVAENALEAFPSWARGSLLIRGNSGDGCADVDVLDDAGGIPPERLSRVFEPLFTTKGESGGLGLGLSMGRRIIEGLGGTLRVNSEGDRSRVSLSVPFEPGLPKIRNEESTWAGRRRPASRRGEER